MKLHWYDRILLAISGLVLVAAGAMVVLSTGGYLNLPVELDVWLGNGWQWLPFIFMGGVLLIALGLWLLLRPILKRGEAVGKYYTVQENGEDGVHISVQALEHLVYKALSVWPEILSTQVRIGGQEDAMRISLRATLQSDVRIPDLIRDVRDEIRHYIEECAGVKVASVKVIIDATKDVKGGKEPKEPKGHSHAVKSLPEATTHVVADMEAKSEPVPVYQPESEPIIIRAEPERPIEPVEPVQEAEEEPADEPLPVTLSAGAFPFPEETAAEEDDRDAR